MEKHYFVLDPQGKVHFMPENRLQDLLDTGNKFAELANRKVPLLVVRFAVDDDDMVINQVWSFKYLFFGKDGQIEPLSYAVPHLIEESVPHRTLTTLFPESVHGHALLTALLTNEDLWCPTADQLHRCVQILETGAYAETWNPICTESMGTNYEEPILDQFKLPGSLRQQ